MPCFEAIRKYPPRLARLSLLAHRRRMENVGRLEHYIMQLTAVVANLVRRKGRGSKTADWKLKLKDRGTRGRDEVKDVATASLYSKMRWFAITGYDPNNPGTIGRWKRNRKGGR